MTYLSVVQCMPFKRIAELISDLSGRKISEGTIQNILRENSDKVQASTFCKTPVIRRFENST